MKTKEKATVKFDSTEDSLNTDYLIGYSRHLEIFVSDLVYFACKGGC